MPTDTPVVAALERVSLVVAFIGLGVIVVVGRLMADQRDTTEQLGWLAWALAAVVVVLVASGIFGFVGMQTVRRRLRDLDAKLVGLHDDIVSMAEPGSTTVGELLALESGQTYHQTGCRVLEGKSDARAVDDGDIEVRGLRPCTLCARPAAQDPRTDRPSATAGASS